MKKAGVVLISSLVLSTSLFTTISVQASENNSLGYTIEDKLDFTKISEDAKNAVLSSNEIQDDASKAYLTATEVNKMTLSGFETIYDDLKIEIESGNYTESQLNEMVTAKIKNMPAAPKSRVSFGELTSEEKKFVALHPIEATLYATMSKNALKEAEKYYSSASLYQGNGDAFRHSYWNAILVKAFGGVGRGKLDGFERAKVWTNAHEQGSKGVDREMDLYNNDAGRYHGYLNYSQSHAQLSTSLRKMVSQGSLVRIVKGNLTATN
ncbi:DUF6973 domain-containing protein [Peribacillus muralis]|uniref:DUF6973 domain-containing protein n=1 Tax=Peribacillus muralis TaxID=264697 RepID=UPI00366CC393